MKKTADIPVDFIDRMDEQLRSDLLKKDEKIVRRQLWENTYIKHQIDKRERVKSFTVNEHIRSMVYSMLSSGTKWESVVEDMDEATGQILPADDIFHGYDPEWLLRCSPEQLSKEVLKLHYGCRFIAKQTEALLHTNIPKLLQFEEQYGAIDNYYAEIIRRDGTLKTLVKTLSDAKSENKMAQMDKPLVSEYLRNVGYDLPKPDRHIRRILGRVLGFENETVPEFEAFDTIAELAQASRRKRAEVDYILWSYCADGFGEICTANNPKCGQCTAKEYCAYDQSEIDSKNKEC